MAGLATLLDSVPLSAFGVPQQQNERGTVVRPRSHFGGHPRLAAGTQPHSLGRGQPCGDFAPTGKWGLASTPSTFTPGTSCRVSFASLPSAPFFIHPYVFAESFDSK